MKKLHMGTDVIAINDAIHCVQKNIEDLSTKKIRLICKVMQQSKSSTFTKRKLHRKQQPSYGLKKLFNSN